MIVIWMISIVTWKKNNSRNNKNNHNNNYDDDVDGDNVHDRDNDNISAILVVIERKKNYSVHFHVNSHFHVGKNASKAYRVNWILIKGDQ